MVKLQNTTRTLVTVLASTTVFLLLGLAWSQQANPAATSATQPTATSAQIARGRYIVNDVAMCINCHTPRNGSGKIETTQLLKGGPVFFQPAQPMSDWPNLCPRIAGNPPGTDQEMITLLTTGIWNTGKPLRDPMPTFHMTREDAEAVVAYLKSLR